MIDRFRRWTQRYPATDLLSLLRHKPRSKSKTSHEKPNGLTIAIEELSTNSDEERSKRPSAFQRPTFGWLSAVSLFLITLLFSVLGLALLLVWHFNNRTNGFTLVTNNHYSWTYGPTAILVLVVALWRQVDYHCKVAMPWIVLNKGGASARKSVLLDYISPLQIMSLWQSLRSGHIIVFFTITGFLVLKLITLASTGLLVEELVEPPVKPVSLNALDTFNGSLYNFTEYVTKPDASIVYTAYGIMAKGLAPSVGTTDSLVYTRYNLPSELELGSGRVQARVEAFVPNFNCQPAEVSINPTPYNGDDTQTPQTIIINSPSCELMGGSQPVFVLDASSELCPPRQFRGVITRVNCSVDATVEPFPNRQLLTLVEVAYNQTLNTSTDVDASTDGTDPDVISWSVGIKNTTSLLCRPSYSLGSLNLTYDMTQGEQQIRTDELEVFNISLANFHDNDLALMFSGALSDAANMFGDLSDSDTDEDFPNTMFKLMAGVSGGRYEDLLDQEVMTKAAESAFAHIAVQLISKNLLDIANSPLSAELTIIESRLRVSVVSFWVMLSGFTAMALLSLLTFWMRPKSGLSVRPETVYGLALVLAQSWGLRNIIRELNGLKEADVARKMDDYFFSSDTSVDSNGRVDLSIQPLPSSDATAPQQSTEPSESDQIWWKPLTSRHPVVLFVLLLPLLVLVALELLQRNSDRDNGFLTLPVATGTAATLSTRLIPALVMLIVAASFNAMDFNISLLAPFNTMNNQAVPANRSIKSSVIDKLPPVALWQALKHRQYSSFCSSAAAIIGSVLTIVVSGLYTVENVTSSNQSLVRSNDTFNTAWANSATNDGSAAVLTSLTESTNLSYPAFTYDELALSEISPPTLGVNSSTAPQMQLTYPALRASLKCSSLDSSSFNVSADYDPELESSNANIDARIPLPQTCPFGGPGGNLSFIELNYQFGFQANQSFVGKLLDLHVGPYDPIQGSAIGESDPSAESDNPPGCPSLAFIYGYVDIDNPSSTSVTTLICYQQMQQIQTSVHFDLPSMSISTTKPPVPDESTIELLKSTPEGDTTFSYRIQQHTDQSLSLFNQTIYASANLQEAPVDNFFQGVLFGRKPLSQDMLVGAENQVTIMQGINAFYRRYMAQAISNTMRVSPEADSSTSSEYTATILNATQTARLVQHREAKLVLQILLGMMSVLGAVVWKLTRLGDLVPYNPCTIFGGMALLAGSDLCREVDADVSLGAGEDVAALKKQESRYRLGWWDDESERSGEGNGGGGGEKDRLRKRRYGVDVVRVEE